MSTSKESNAPETPRTHKWIAPAKGGYSGSLTRGSATTKKREPPKNPASSAPAYSFADHKGADEHEG